MSHECFYCGAELEYHDSWGIGAYWQRDNNPEGSIYRCPNHDGFENEEEAIDYMVELGGTIMMEEFGWSSWKDIVCDSSTHHVSGMSYTDRSEDLKEGYPC